MNRFNGHMNSHFSGCRLLARAYDEARKRRVTIHQIPGHWDVVGVSDGVDSWIAPSTAGAFFKTATGDVADIMRRLQAGEPVPPPPDAPKRPRIALMEIAEAPPTKTAKRTRHALV